MSNWVLVKDALPEKSGLYICTVIYCGDSIVNTRRYLKQSNEWVKEGNHEDIIAWQELPEPYTDKSEELGWWVEWQSANGGCTYLCSQCGNANTLLNAQCPQCKAKMQGAVTNEFYYDKLRKEANK